MRLKDLWNLLLKSGFGQITVQVSDGILYPTEDTVIKMHDFLIGYFRGQKDEIHRGEILKANIQFAIYHVMRVGNELRDGRERLLVKAAHVMNQFFTGHGFTDGNKRTGLSIAWLFLTINDVATNDVLQNYDDHVKFFKVVADRPMTTPENVPELLEWIKKNLIH